MEPIATTPLPQRPQWDIDCRLERLIGQEVRVAGESFVPVCWNGQVRQSFIHVRDLILPDNTKPGVLPVFFEGRLCRFERRIGVVCVALDLPRVMGRAAEGTVLVRGIPAVLLRGPAIVRLAFPFRVEPLPADEANYWEDLRLPTAQFRLPFDSASETVLYPASKECR
jgi:hypothetical protein